MLRSVHRDTGVEPRIPLPATLWGPARNWLWVTYLALILAAIPDYFVQFWFNTSLNFHSVFFTNLKEIGRASCRERVYVLV